MWLWCRSWMYFACNVQRFFYKFFFPVWAGTVISASDIALIHTVCYSSTYTQISTYIYLPCARTQRRELFVNDSSSNWLWFILEIGKFKGSQTTTSLLNREYVHRASMIIYFWHALYFIYVLQSHYIHIVPELRD